jgi:uncharacterized protein (DUF433 family)
MTLLIDTEPIPLKEDADGVIRVARTRVTLDTVVQTYLDGATAEEIVQQYPSLNLADVYAVISYFLRHSADVESYLQRRQKQADSVCKENESRFSAQGIRMRLATRSRGK